MDTPQINKPETKINPEQKTKTCSCASSGKSKILIILAIALGIIVLMLGSFAGGVKIGIYKAKFSCDWGQNYERNFIGGRPGMPGGGEKGGMMGMLKNFEGRDFRNAHGLAGTIISIADNNLVVKDRDNKENTVAVSDQTVIKSGRNDFKIGDLKVNDQVVVMGQPGDNGVIDATLIRVFPGNQNTNQNN